MLIPLGGVVLRVLVHREFLEGNPQQKPSHILTVKQCFAFFRQGPIFLFFFATRRNSATKKGNNNGNLMM